MMSPRMPTPVEVGSIVGKTFRITWSDGHRSTSSWKALRLACPCAHCRGEWADGRTVDPSSIREDVHPMRIVRGVYGSTIRAGRSLTLCYDEITLHNPLRSL